MEGVTTGAERPSPSRRGEPRKLWIEGPAGRLEAVLRTAAPARAAAVLAHPHPMHGGSLHNPVVFHADRELNRAGWTTLRFNFRGVGTSAGSYDGGRGEVDDVGAAAAWLRGVAPGVSLVLAGYSFGSGCAIRYALRDETVAAVVAIGLPVRSEPFDEIARLGRPLAVVQASEDELGTPEEVQAVLSRGHPPGRLLVVPGTSHLFPGHASHAAALVVEAGESLLNE